MSRSEHPCVVDTPSTDQEVTVTTQAFVPFNLANYDDGSLGCEAMIGGLEIGISYSRLRGEAT